jgi:hypothetical protein
VQRPVNKPDSSSITLVRPLGRSDSLLWLVEQDHWEQSPREMVARRFPRSDQRLQKDCEALRHSVECARSVDHDNVAKVFGYSESKDEIVVLMERVQGLSLQELVQHCACESIRLDPRLCVWLMRELVRVLNELSAQQKQTHAAYQLSSGLNLSRIIASSTGQIKIMDLARTPASPQTEQIDRVIEMLLALMKIAEPQVQVGDGSVQSREICAQITGAVYPDLNSLETALARMFYRTYLADDERHGRQQLKTLVTHIAGDPTRPKHQPALPDSPTQEQLAPAKGELTRVLESRHEPVVPQALTNADRVTGLQTQSSGYARTQSPGTVQTQIKRPPSRIIWFTTGFVFAILTMVLYFVAFVLD